MVTQTIICGARGFSLCPRLEYQEIFSLSYITQITKAAFNVSHGNKEWNQHNEIYMKFHNA